MPLSSTRRHLTLGLPYLIHNFVLAHIRIKTNKNTNSDRVFFEMNFCNFFIVFRLCLSALCRGWPRTLGVFGRGFFDLPFYIFFFKCLFSHPQLVTISRVCPPPEPPGARKQGGGGGNTKAGEAVGVGEPTPEEAGGAKHKKQCFVVAVVALCKSGKSTFLNALMGCARGLASWTQNTVIP